MFVLTLLYHYCLLFRMLCSCVSEKYCREAMLYTLGAIQSQKDAIVEFILDI